MSAPTGHDAVPETGVTVRYWAAARAAAGVAEDRIPAEGPLSVTEIRDAALALHPDSAKLADVLKVCSVLIDEQPLGRRDPAEVSADPGATVEFLPPFAGG